MLSKAGLLLKSAARRVPFAPTRSEFPDFNFFIRVNDFRTRDFFFRNQATCCFPYLRPPQELLVVIAYERIHQYDMLDLFIAVALTFLQKGGRRRPPDTRTS
jgi:hypothetical protein